MKRKLFLTLGLLTIGTIGLFAQINNRKKDSTLVIKYLIGSDWNFTFGNVNSFITVNQAQLDLQQQVIGTKVLVRYRYGELEKITNYNEFYSNAELMFFPKNRVYGFVNGGAEFSFLRSVNLRAWGGLGAGFKVWNTVEHVFEPNMSVNYEYNNYATPILYRGDSTSIVHTVVANIGWTGSHKFFGGKLLLVHNFKWVQDMLYATNYKFDGGFTLAVPVIKNLMFKTAIVGSYQNVVPPPKRQADLIWTIGLAWGNL
jgi:hypothetical protein